MSRRAGGDGRGRAGTGWAIVVLRFRRRWACSRRFWWCPSLWSSRALARHLGICAEVGRRQQHPLPHADSATQLRCRARKSHGSVRDLLRDRRRGRHIFPGVPGEDRLQSRLLRLVRADRIRSNSRFRDVPHLRVRKVAHPGAARGGRAGNGPGIPSPAVCGDAGSRRRSRWRRPGRSPHRLVGPATRCGRAWSWAGCDRSPAERGAGRRHLLQLVREGASGRRAGDSLLRVNGATRGLLHELRYAPRRRIELRLMWHAIVKGLPLEVSARVPGGVSGGSDDTPLS